MTKTVRPARVLLVSYWFAPFSTMASIRASKLAKYLADRGYDIRVLSAEGADPDVSLALELPREAIVYTRWDRAGHRLGKLLASLKSPRAAASGSGTADSANAAPTASTEQTSKKVKLRAALRDIYRNIVEWPDSRAGWRKYAVEAGNRLIEEWRPDVIYATAPPATTLIVADQLSRASGVPWVAELRDLWTDNPYYNYSPLRLPFERRWEVNVLSRSAAIVTVSPGWRQRLLDRYRKPVTVAMNGFVAADFPFPSPAEPETAGPLRVVFTGHVYAGYRDPSPLFEALRQLQLGANDVIVEFIGTKDKAIEPIADRFGLSDQVRVRPSVPYTQALEHQLRADVLLHMQWCDPKEKGTIAGKIFDYLGARRPILGIALEDSVVAELVHQRGAGLVTNDARKIARQIEQWLAQKRDGGIPPLPAAASQGLERSAQFEAVGEVLAHVIGARQGALPNRRS